MNTRKASLILVCGIMLGVALVFATRAQDKPALTPKKDWSQLRVVTYASGLTGFFDPESGKLFLYDSNLEKCHVIRELTELGEPLKTLRN